MRVPIAKARNLGPKSAIMLSNVGVNFLDELLELGPVTCFKMVRASLQTNVSRNLLYALYGAAHDIHWAELPQSVKDDLIAATEHSDSPFF